MSAQFIQLGFACICLPIFSFFSVLAWFIGSLCLVLKMHITHGRKACLFAGKRAVSVAVVVGCSGCIACTGSVFRADFLFMHDLCCLSLGYPKILGALTDTWLQINSRRPEQIGTRPSSCPFRWTWFPPCSWPSPKQGFT